MVAALLCLLALVDAGFAGFRAATGRNALIRKRAYYLRAARRGFWCGTTGLALVAALCAVVLANTADPAARYEELVRAGTRMLHVLAPFGVLVAASIVAYWLLPMRPSTFVILVGLGPLTLVRPAVVVAAAAWSVAGATDWLVWTVALTAAASVLAVEPAVHHRWYRPGLRAAPVPRR